MNPKPSLAGRAALAVALMIGFYALALALAAVLLWLPYAEIRYANRIHARLILFCVVGAGVILWSVIPRIDKFVPPGPRLKPSDHPRLFDELSSVARAVNQAMPAEVYLVPDVNAWVSQRGGTMGLGSRRVMGLGLPLMQVLTVPELRAVLAHEFGHFYGGDTKLGPWVYKTRGAIGRTLEGLSQHSSLLQLPFVWYGKMFLRVTHAVSRRQEYTADELAARTVGAGPLISGLRKIHGAGLAFGPYWTGEFVPLMKSGCRPPLGEGFARYLQAQAVSTAVDQAMDKELKGSKSNPYDTHPALRDRLAALKELPAGDETPDGHMAVTLLASVPELETELLAALLGKERAEKLRAIAWAEAGEKVYFPQWTETVRKFSSALEGMTPESLAGSSEDIKSLGKRLEPVIKRHLDTEEAGDLATFVVGSALSLVLKDRGYALECGPGEETRFVKGASVIQPFKVLPALIAGELSPEAWHQQCAEAGLAGVNLGIVAPDQQG